MPMPRIAACLFFLCIPLLKSIGQNNYWQQELKYKINVELDTKKQQLKSHLQLVYINHSPDTLSFIWFHLWVNAYQNFSSPFYYQLVADNTFDKDYFKNQMGYIKNLNFKVNDVPVSVLPNAASSEMLQLSLPSPLAPGDSVLISTPFDLTLPNYFSRMGFAEDQYMLCQWFPKPAVYDKYGWHTFPYLERGEFYGEFGSFDVTITLPQEYVVAATGILTTEDELEKYKNIGRANLIASKKPMLYKSNNKKEQLTKTLQYKAEKVHDFAWFANKNFVIQYDSLQLPSGKKTEIFTFFKHLPKSAWYTSTQMVKATLNAYSTWVGEYPYPTAQVVQGPFNLVQAGMEYPMVTLISDPGYSLEKLDGIIAHEVGHNWFYGILGTNEREHPWMDEGLNTFYQSRYEALKYEIFNYFNQEKMTEFKSTSPKEYQNSIEEAFTKIKNKTPIDSRAESFLNKDEYFNVTYYKTAYWLLLVENRMGNEAFETGMKYYFDTWKFKHPYPDDFKKALESSSHISLEEVFRLLQK